MAGLRMLFWIDSIGGDAWDAQTQTDSHSRYRLCNLLLGPGELWATCGESGQRIRSRTAIDGDTSLDVDVTFILKKC